MWVGDFVQCIEQSSVNASRWSEASEIKERNLPTRIYKYRALNSYALNNLAENTVWLCSPDVYNDPFDCAIKILDEQVKKAVEQRFVEVFVSSYKLDRFAASNAIEAAKASDDPLGELAQHVLRFDTAPGSHPEQIAATCRTAAPQLVHKVLSEVQRWRKLTKICSFSTVNNSILMWSHYAANHSGFCLEYDIEPLPPEHLLRKYLFPVVYSRQIYDLTPWARSLVNRDSGSFNAELPLLLFLHKFDGWGYEHEWRLLELGTDERVDHNSAVPKPSKIFLGARIADADRAELLGLCADRGIEVCQMRLATNTFDLLSENVS